MVNLTILKRTAILGAVIIGLPATANAQFARNSNAPTDIAADSAVYEQGLTILTGQVDVRQEEVRILSDLMKIYSGQGSGTDALEDIRRIEATGNFYYITPDQEVRGDKGVYVRATDSFTVTGNVILLQGEDNVVTGDKLIYQLSTNEARVVGSCKGRRCGRKGRVNILIKNTGASTAP